MIEVAHFYHLWADGEWAAPVTEHFTALTESGFQGPVYLGLVGRDSVRHQAEGQVKSLWPGELTVCAEADSGFEQVTLSPVREYAREARARFIMYAHTKGAYRRDPLNDLWRRDMIRLVISGWRDCAALLEDHDAVGGHWLTSGTSSPDKTIAVDGPPFFAGNFWMATSVYLAGLAEPGTASRFEAEGWIGTDCPRVHDLAPGWPVYDVTPHASPPASAFRPPNQVPQSAGGISQMRFSGLP